MSAVDRRTFLSFTGALVAPLAFPLAAGATQTASAAQTADAAPAAAARAAGAAQAAGAPKAPGPHTGRIIVNALGSLDDPNLDLDPKTPRGAPSKSNPTPNSEEDPFTERVLREAHASGLTAVNVTLGYVAGDMEPYEATIRDIARTDAAIRLHANDLIKVYSAADIRRAASERRIGIIYGFQNAQMMGHDATRVDTFGGLGVRVIQLTYNPANPLGDGSMAPGNRGLTAFGREVVERLNANRIMVDLSHSGEHTCLDAARASRQPISINHTGCRALTDLPRNKTDEELRLVAERGGFVGIYFMPFLKTGGHASAADVVAHIEHAVNVCGEDHVGIGTDGSVTSIDDLDAYRAVLAKEIEARRAAGISAAGEGPDTFPFVVDLRGVNQFHELTARLQSRGFASSRIDRILGLNFLRFAKDVWGS
ncbi:MAG TPA: membrane dipeptidase [Steroidobacteraceae bacterium]|nr:membrane dipeptidase [Steroidobacteraceae bacterium]